MEVLETFFHQFYAESNGFRLKKLFSLHFLILNIILEKELAATLGEKLKNMFKIKK